MAIGCGLNMAIANPLFPELMELTLASDALAGRDAHQLAYLAKFSGAAPEKSTQSKAALTPTEKLYRAVMPKGLRARWTRFWRKGKPHRKF